MAIAVAHADWMPRRMKSLWRRRAIVYRLCLRLRSRGRKILQFLARLETNRFARRDADHLACAGVAANAGLASLDVEDTEAAQFDAIAAAQRVLHGFENGFDGLLGLRPRNTSFSHNGVYDIQLDHNTLPRRGNLC